MRDFFAMFNVDGCNVLCLQTMRQTTYNNLLFSLLWTFTYTSQELIKGECFEVRNVAEVFLSFSLAFLSLRCFKLLSCGKGMLRGEKAQLGNRHVVL